ncbi:MAG: BamA/TamA family outer membrane protein [Alkalinema sp. RU_4_3]|nr:BamA/TamA family outer membrane protein [Alkalinema sp. RU_4_3]
MRVPAVAMFSIATVMVGESSATAATAPMVPSAPPVPAKDWVVPTETPVSLPKTAAIAPPETLPMIAAPQSLPQSLPQASPKVALAATQAIAPAAPTPPARAAVLVVSTEEATPIAPVASTALPPSVAPKAPPIAIAPAPVVVAAAPKAMAPKPFATPKPVAPKPVTPKPVAPKPLPQPPANVAVTVTSIQLNGVGEELRSLLQKQLQTQPGSQVTQLQLQKDLALLKETGLVQNASVQSQTTPDGIAVTFQIAPTIVRSIQLVNAQALTQSVVNGIFQPQFNQAIQPAALDAGVRQVNQWYAQNGFPLARVVGLDPSASGTMTLNVAEGKISTIKLRFTDEFGRTVDDKGVAIKPRTKDSVILQEIQTKPGAIVSEASVTKDIERLYKTGLFTNVQVTPEGDGEATTLVYNIVEARTRQFNLGGGYGSDSGLYGTALYRDNNLGGTGKQLNGNVLFGTKDFQFDGTFSNPYRDSKPNTWGYSVSAFRQRGLSRVFDDDIKLANGDRVREGRIGGGVTLDKPLGNGWVGTAGLNYTRVSLRDAKGNLVRTDAQGNELSFSKTGLDDLTTVSFSAARDQRDNPFDPKQGSLFTVSTEQSVPLGSGKILSNRLQAAYTQYVPVSLLNKNTDPAKQEVLAFNLQGGTIIGDLPPTAPTPSAASTRCGATARAKSAPDAALSRPPQNIACRSTRPSAAPSSPTMPPTSAPATPCPVALGWCAIAPAVALASARACATSLRSAPCGRTGP